jgi:hypothetical protein
MKRDSNEYRAYSTEQIGDWIKRYRASGLGLRAFAAQHGLSKGRLHYWVYDRRHSHLATPPAAIPRFRELKLAEGLGLTNWAAEVGLSSGVAVRFSASATADWIGAVVAALQRSC